jgi:hypothetical protein
MTVAGMRFRDVYEDDVCRGVEYFRSDAPGERLLVDLVADHVADAGVQGDPGTAWTMSVMLDLIVNGGPR